MATKGDTMPQVTLEHNLTDYELKETLEKALSSVGTKIQRPGRKFPQPALETVARRVTVHFDDQLRKMMRRIEAVIRG